MRQNVGSLRSELVKIGQNFGFYVEISGLVQNWAKCWFFKIRISQNWSKFRFLGRNFRVSSKLGKMLVL